MVPDVLFIKIKIYLSDKRKLLEGGQLTAVVL